MPNLKDPKVAIPIVLFAGILWSFGPYVVRHIDQPETVIWQYLFTRGLVIFFLLNIYLFLEEGSNFHKNYFKVGMSGLVGGVGLGSAMITFIWSITNTTAAITLLCLAAMPFITALLGFLFLKEEKGLLIFGLTSILADVAIWGSLSVLTISISKIIFNAGSWGYGLMDGFYGVGALLSTIVSGYFIARTKKQNYLLICFFTSLFNFI